MASDGKVVFQIEGDARGVKTTIKDVTNDIEKETKKWDNAVKESSDDMTKSFAKAFGIERLKNWGIQAAKAIGKFIGEAISAASDLAEVQNVVDVTFGDSARQIQTWSEQAGKQYGLTETQAKRYASTIGAMLKSQGTAQKDVLEMSESLAGLAADMASFYNLDFDTAFEKIRAGISGETMPLKQLGINMSVANLEAFALEQGITKSYAAMSQGEQTMLRYQYLMKATADAQGDFARTSDSMANATRRVQASWETIKTKGGALLLQVIEPLTSGLADFLDKLTETPERTVLDDFFDIDSEYIAGIDKLNATVDKANDLVNVMRNLEAQTVSLGNGQFKGLASLFEDIANVERNGGNARDYLSGLGLDADAIYQKYQVWNESVKQLTSSIPSLNAVINEQTGAIDGGTAAIQRNVDEFQAAEEKKLRLTAYYAKQRAIEEKRGELFKYELDAGAAQQAVKRQLAYIDELRRQMGKPDGYMGYIVHSSITATYSEEEKQWNAALDQLHKYEDEAERANEEYERQSDALKDARQQLADAEEYLVDTYGEEIPLIEEATSATGEFTEEAKEAQEELKMYMATVASETAKAVDSIVKGFSVIERPTQDLFEKRSKLIQQQNELNRSTKDGEKKYQELQKQIDELNKSMDEYSPTGMKNGLESQLAFMDEYIKNLEKAQQMGLSVDLLASLSDGSTASAEYLANLVANPEQAAQVDALYQQVQEKKKAFTDALTAQKLSADETYDAIAQKAKETVDGLAMGDEAKAAMEDTTNGLAEGLNNGADKIASAVDRIIAELNRIPSIQFNSAVGAIVGNINSHLLDGSHETGLDYVPFDGYLASLHEGESILTAEENRIWQRFKNGASPQSMDYDALGATMRENVQAGGNVYLDGKTVGRVISDQQGNSYRQLQRSGWQA